MVSIEEQIEALTPAERAEYIILLRLYINENSSYGDYSRKHKELREFESKHGLNTK